MTFPESLKKPTSKMLWQFAAGWLVFFLVLGGRNFWRGHGNTGIWFSVVALSGPALCWLAPMVFRVVFQMCAIAVFPIGWIVSQLSLAVIFFGAITPLAFLFRLTGRDRLRRRRNAHSSSYWKNKTGPASVRRYFRPY